MTRRKAIKKISAIILITAIVLSIMVVFLGCSSNDFTNGETPRFFDEQHIFLDVGETAELDIRQIFRHSGINISRYELSSRETRVATVERNRIIAVSGGNSAIELIGHTVILATLFDRDTMTRHIAEVAHVFVVDESNMTEIKTVADLQAISDNPHGHFIIKADIDMAGAEWTSVNFAGMLINRGEYIIRNLTGSSLFAENRGFVDGVILENVYIDKSQSAGWVEAGTIAHRNFGTIANSRVDGTVLSSRIAGGIVGYNFSHGRIINSHFSGVVRNISQRSAEEILNDRENNPSDVAGGIVGINQGGVVTYSTATGQITASFIAGGIVGINRTSLWEHGSVINNEFIYDPNLTHRLIAPIWGTPVGWEESVFNRG